MNFVFPSFRSSVVGHLAGSVIVGTLEWLLAIYAMRYMLKLLLMYKGWMYEERGKNKSISKTTMLWFYLVKLFYGWHKPMLYSFQGSLPRLPLPPVKDTMKRVRTQKLFSNLQFDLKLNRNCMTKKLFLVSAKCSTAFK